MKKFLSVIFLITWVAGEVPRLWWKETVLVRPMDVAAGLIVVMDLLGGIRRIRRIRRGGVILNIGLIIAAAILGPIAARTLVYGWLIWRGREIFGGVKKWIGPAVASFLILGLGQYVFFPDMRFLLQYGWDEHYWRLVGTVLDPNYFGVMAGMILLSSFTSSSPLGQSTGRVLSSSSSMISKTLSSIRLLALLSFVGLVLTFSRASWAAMTAAVGWWGLAGKSGGLWRLGILGLLGVFGVIVWWAVPKPGGEGVNLMRTSTITQRLVSWREAVEVWKQHPWVGVGFKGYGSELPSSSWLVILETMGILGSVGVMMGVIWVIREIREDRFWMAMAIMVGIHAIFNNTLFYPPVLGLAAMMRAMK